MRSKKKITKKTIKRACQCQVIFQKYRALFRCGAKNETTKTQQIEHVNVKLFSRSKVHYIAVDKRK
jgi:hypothetical protein